MDEKRNYGGRNTLPDDLKRDVFLKVRLKQQEKKQIELLHQKSLYKNFSDLVRDVLLRKPIRVKIADVKVDRLEKQINDITRLCSYILRTKRKPLEDFKPQVEEILNEMRDISSKIDGITLSFEELKQTEKWEKKYKPETDKYSW